MSVCIYHLSLLLGISSPEHKDNILTLLTYGFDNGIREAFPALSLVTRCHAFSNRKHRVQQQNALVGPALQVSMHWNLDL